MPTYSSIRSAPPLPSDPAEIRRVEHTRLRRRVLYNLHEQDIVTRLTAVGLECRVLPLIIIRFLIVCRNVWGPIVQPQPPEPLYQQ